MSSSPPPSDSFRKPSSAAPSTGADNPVAPVELDVRRYSFPVLVLRSGDWENSSPLPPPDSVLFDRKKSRVQHHLPLEAEGEESEQEALARPPETVKVESVSCSEWSEHCMQQPPPSSSDPEWQEIREVGRDILKAARSDDTHSQAAPSEIASSLAAKIKSLPRTRSDASSSSSANGRTTSRRRQSQICWCRR